MNEEFVSYLNDGTERITELFLTSSVDEAERKKIIAMYIGRIRDNLSSGAAMGDSVQMIDTVCIGAIDERITELLGMEKLNAGQCDAGAGLCERLEALIARFKEKHWKLPLLNNVNTKKCAGIFNKKKSDIDLRDRIVDSDIRLTEMIGQARSDFSIPLCEKACALIAEIKQDITECREKGMPVPAMNNSDLDKCLEEINGIKEKLQERSGIIDKIVENDKRFDEFELAGIHEHPKRWDDVLELCSEQRALFEELSSKGWKIPDQINTSPLTTEDRISLYIKMMKTDEAISAAGSDNVALLKNCMEQKNSINECSANGWGIPVLANPDPSETYNEALKRTGKIELKRVANIVLKISAVLAALILIFLIIVAIVFLIRHVRIPFDSEDVEGEGLEDIQEALEDAGFKDIELIPVTGGWAESYVVKEVLIDDEPEYSKGEFVEPDVEVSISYYSSGRINVTSIMEGWEVTDVNSLTGSLSDAGLTNIIVEEVPTTDVALDGMIVTVLLNNEADPYKQGDCFLPADAEVRLSCYKHMISMFAGLSEIRGRDYLAVKDEFAEAGFTDVELEEVRNGENWYDEGEVFGVAIGGDETFLAGDLFYPDAPVTIYYNGAGRRDISDILDDWKNKTWVELRDLLEKKGIKDVSFEEVITDDPAENQFVRNIYIYDKLFTGGECHVDTSAKIRISYGQLRIAMSQPSSYYVQNNKVNYKDVKKEFEDMGFATIILRRSDDLFLGIGKTEGSIKSIKIGDSSSFAAGESFDYDKKITIVVYTFPGRGCEDISLKE